MSVQVGAAYLEKEHGGRGVLLGGVPGVPPGNVCVIGAASWGPMLPRLRWAWGQR